jgi:hypothetical protein
MFLSLFSTQWSIRGSRVEYLLRPQVCSEISNAVCCLLVVCMRVTTPCLFLQERALHVTRHSSPLPLFSKPLPLSLAWNSQKEKSIPRITVYSFFLHSFLLSFFVSSDRASLILSSPRNQVPITNSKCEVSYVRELKEEEVYLLLFEVLRFFLL